MHGTECQNKTAPSAKIGRRSAPTQMACSPYGWHPPSRGVRFLRWILGHDACWMTTMVIRRWWISTVVLVAVACGAVVPPEDTPCPSAPFREAGFDWSCTGHAQCEYRAPRMFGLTTEDPINPLRCSCENGGWICAQTAMGLSPPPRPVCPEDLVEGAGCVWIDGGVDRTQRARNAECLVLGPRASLDAGVVDGKSCACDYPGPKWRCVPVETLK